MFESNFNSKHTLTHRSHILAGLYICNFPYFISPSTAAHFKAPNPGPSKVIYTRSYVFNYLQDGRLVTKC